MEIARLPSESFMSLPVGDTPEAHKVTGRQGRGPQGTSGRL